MDECMQDLAAVWNEGKELYDLLAILARRGIFDEDFQRGLESLTQIAVDRSWCSYLQAQRAYAQGAYQEAAEAMRQTLACRAIDLDYWQLAMEICQKLGDAEGQYYFATLINTHGGDIGRDLFIPFDNPVILQIIGQARINPSASPFYVKFFRQAGKVTDGHGNLVGQYLHYENIAGYRDFCGVYNPRQWQNMRGGIASLLDDMHMVPHGYCDFPFEVMKCRTEKKVTVECPVGRSCILPIAADKPAQSIDFINRDEQRTLAAAQWEFDYFRCQEGRTEIEAEEPFHIAEPIWLGHDRKRKKLVLNILADGLPWQVVKKQDYRTVPNIMRFFRNGVIFDDTFSVAEFTYPALASIETGCYPYRTQIFNDKVPTRISNAFPVISRQMKELGYYCTNLMSDSAGIYNGVLRGFDRHILHQITCPAYEAVERCIEHLDAFAETDNYVYLHVSDAHPFNSNVRLAPYTQTSLPWQERILGEYGTSVHKKSNALNMMENQYSIQHMDRCLGWLFEYIEEHYDEEEYVVNLFSDHGVSVYDESNYLLSENQSGIAMMMRGADIPALGLVDELTSVLDFYPLMDKEIGFSIPYQVDGRLPKVLGGQGRQYAVSMSIYPGQTFKLALRNLDYEFRLETAAFTQIGGLVDMRDYTVHIYRRDNRQEVFSQEIRERFMEEAVRHIKSFAVFG